MGYRELKIQAEEKMKRIKRICLCVVVVLLAGLFIFSFFYPPESWKYYFSTPDLSARKKNEMRVHFLDVGQGDCILIELPDGQTMLVDGGGRGAKTEKTILRYLNALKIDTIDHLLITHSDDDHCGAIGEIVRQKAVRHAYLPTSYDLESGAFAEAYAQLAKENCTLVETNRTVNLSVEGKTPYTLCFLYPYSYKMTYGDNEGSAVFWLDYMGVSFLFAGDAPIEVEEGLLRDDGLGLLDKRVSLSSTEILKVSHHGSANASSWGFLSYLNLQTAIISCGKDNAYNHPADVVMEKLEMLSADVYRTDEKGHIIVTVDVDGNYGIKTVKS